MTDKNSNEDKEEYSLLDRILGLFKPEELLRMNKENELTLYKTLLLFDADCNIHIHAFYKKLLSKSLVAKDWLLIERHWMKIAHFFNEGFFADSSVIELMQMIEEKCSETLDGDGIRAYVLNFKLISKTLEKKNPNKFLNALDWIFEMVDGLSGWWSLKKLARSVLDEFENRLNLEKIGARANPSFKYIINIHLNKKPLKLNVDEFRVVYEHSCAEYFIHFLIKEFYNTRTPISFLNTFFASKSDSDRRFVHFFKEHLFEIFDAQHKNNAGELTPKKTVATARLIETLYKHKLITREEFERVLKIFINGISDGVTDTMVRCFFALNLRDFDTSNDNAFQIQKVQVANLIRLHLPRVYQSNKKDQNLPEKAEYSKIAFKPCPLAEIPTRDAEHCAKVVIDNLMNVRQMSEKILKDFYDFCIKVKSRKFKVDLKFILKNEIITKGILPMEHLIKWRQLKNLGYFMTYSLSIEGFLCNDPDRLCLYDQYDFLFGLFRKRTILDMKSKNFYQTASFFAMLSEIYKNSLMHSSSYYFGVFLEARGKVNKSFDKLVAKMIANFDKTLVIDPKNLNENVSVTLKRHVNEILLNHKKFLVTNNQYPAVTINDFELCAEFYVKNAQFYPFKRSSEFAMRLKKDAMNGLKEDDRVKLVEEIVKVTKKFFEGDEAKSTRSKVGNLKFIANLWLNDLIDDEFVKVCDAKVVESVKASKDKVNLLCYSNFCVYLRKEMRKSKKKLNLMPPVDGVDLNLIKDIKSEEDLDEIDKPKKAVKVKVKRKFSVKEYEAKLQKFIDEAPKVEKEIFDVDSFKLFVAEFEFISETRVREKLQKIKNGSRNFLKAMAKSFLEIVELIGEGKLIKVVKALEKNFEGFKEVLIKELRALLTEKLTEISIEDEKTLNLINCAVKFFNFGWICFDDLHRLLQALIDQKKYQIALQVLKKSSQKLIENEFNFSFDDHSWKSIVSIAEVCYKEEVKRNTSSQ